MKKRWNGWNVSALVVLLILVVALAVLLFDDSPSLSPLKLTKSVADCATLAPTAESLTQYISAGADAGRFAQNYPKCASSANKIRATDTKVFESFVEATRISGGPRSWTEGDMNCDGVLSYADINPFVLALSSQQSYQQQYPNCNFMNADVNCDGVVSYADINPFVACLGGNCQSCQETCIVGNIECSTGKLCRFDGTCVLNETIVPNFKAYELTSVDSDGTEHWQEINLTNETIELGAKIKLDASSTTGPAAIFFWNSGVYYNICQTNDPYSPLCVYKANSNNNPVTLTVYSEDSTQYPSITKTITAEGMGLIGQLFVPIPEHRPTAITTIESQMWIYAGSTAGTAKLGVSNISDPRNPSPVQPVNTEQLSATGSFASYGGFLYIANRGEGVPIYLADKDHPNLVGRITTAELEGHNAVSVARIGTGLYVAGDLGNKIYVFDLSSSPTVPRFVTSIEIPVSSGNIQEISAGSNYLMVREFYGSSVYVIDGRSVNQPILLPGLPLETIGSPRMSCGQSVSAVLASGGTRIIVFPIDEQGNMKPTITGIIPSGSIYMAMSDSRLYINRGEIQRIEKYDIADPTMPYQMESYITSTGAMTRLFLMPPGSQTDPEVLYSSYQSSFLIFGL